MPGSASPTAAADPWLEALTTAGLQARQAVTQDGVVYDFTFGSLLLRTFYHYWYYTGENMAIRHLFGHHDRPEFVGKLDDEVP